jgi:hypothetical protein
LAGGGGGGGFAAVKRSSTFLVIAAGGGGGGGGGNAGSEVGSAGGAGGGTSGLAGASGGGCGGPGGGGTQSAGGAGGSGSGCTGSAGAAGSLNQGGDGGNNGGGGGGAGQHGGGGGQGDDDGGAGGGGGSGLGDTLIAGSSVNAGNNSDSDYALSAGQGGAGGAAVDGAGGDGNPGRVVLIPSGPAGVPTNYRSIGTNSGILYNTGTASITSGTTTVTFGGGASLPVPTAVGAVGQGDKLTIGATVFHILSRDSATQVTVQETAGSTLTDQTYTIMRAYNTPQAWETDREGDLVGANRHEVGVAYADGIFTGPTTEIVRVQGSTTDATHYMELIVAQGQRHDGTAGSGVVFDGADTTKHGVRIIDSYTRVQGLEMKRFRSASGAAGVFIDTGAANVLLEDLLIYDFDSAANSVAGIHSSGSLSFTVRNCIIYDGDTAGIRGNAGVSGTIQNTTIHGMASRGVFEDGGTFAVTNTIAMGNPTDFDVVNGTQSYNLSSDATATGTGSLSNKLAANQFVSLTAGSEDFHLKAGADAIDAGTSLAGSFTDDIDGDTRPLGAAWDIGADEGGGAGPGTATLSSAANQTFAVGQAAAAASTLTITDAATSTITAAQDIRIRIPAALNMTWDPTVTTITPGGGAAGKVSATGVTYEDSNRTAVINVTSNFAASDVVTIAGLKFTSFTAVSSATSLQLVVAGSGGATAATDDKTVTIIAATPASLSSAANQTFTVGQTSTTASTLTVTDGSPATITDAQNLRIRIPAALNMTWDPTVTTVTLGGAASSNVSATLMAYEDSNRTVVLDVTSSFTAGQILTITGLKFTNFTATSSASNLELVVTGSGGTTAATDDKTITIVAAGALSLSSAANQSFTVGQVSTAAIQMTVTDGPTPTITTTNDIRIRIPAALNMTWDTSVTTVTLGGGAAGKVSATGVTYEASNKTVVISVSSNFAANDQVTIAGLKFTSFTAVSSASSLQLVVAGAGGATAATDDKTITIVSVITLSSAANQTFTVGQASTTASTLTITESSTPTITTSNEIRIRIPATLSMTWDPSITSITRGGTASSKVSATVAYEDSNKTVRVNVTTDFAANDTLTIAGLKFTNFTAVSVHNLQLVVAGSGGATAAIDDKTVTIIGAGITNEETVSACVAPGSGVITFDAASAQAGSSSGSTSLTWSHTVTSAGSDRILIVGVGVDQNQSCCRTVTGVTYGGVSMAVVPSGISTNANRTRSELWYLVNPPTGTNNVVVTLSGSADVRAGATSYTGVNQATPLGTAIGATGSSSTASVSGVSSAAGELVVDAAALESTSSYFTAPGAGQTSRYTSHGTDGGGSNNNVPIAGSSEPGAASVTMSWSMEASKAWAIVAVPLKPASATLTSLTLPSWTPQPNELLLVGISMRDETISHSVSGNGLTWTLVADRDNDRGQMGVALYRASGASPTAGSIMISLPGNTLPAYAVAVRMSNVDTAVNQGIEAVATASGGAVTDDANMKVSVTTLTANAIALAWGGQRGSATLSLPAGETIINQSSADCGTSGDRMRGHMWQETVVTPAATQLGQDNSLNSAHPWAAIAVSIKPVPPTPPQPPGRFNAFDPTTVAGGLTGFIRTKLAGDTVSLDVVALNSTRTAIDTAFTGTVKVEVLDASNNTGGYDGNGCRSTWAVIQTLSNPTFAAGDNGRKTISFTQANSYKDVRLRISYPTSSPTLIGCSNDNFAIRPSALVNFAVSDGDWQTAGTTRALTSTSFATLTHKAGRPMSVGATAINATGTTAATNYTGAPTQWLSACAGAACTANFGTLTLATTFAAGQLTTNVASYSDVGAFALQLVDSTYASVDVNDTIGDCTASGSYTCSATIDVGRFVPDNFAVSLNTPTFGSACGSFTYIGQNFNFGTAPVITLTARNSAGSTTTRYAGSWWRITNATLTGKAYTTASGTLDTSGAPGTDPVINAAGSGTGTLTFSSGTGFFFPRTTPVAPFDAEISLAVNVIDADGISYASNPARFGTATAGNGIAFSTGKPMRFGRFAIGNANGSQLVPLLVRVEAQYWSGSPTNAFITNTLDNCTSVAPANFAMGNYTGNLSGSPTCETAISGGGTLSSGRGTLILATPGAANDGSVMLTANLGATASGSTCTTLGGAPVSATTANLPHLQGNWTGGAYDANPSARASFGVYKGSEEVIYMRENF